jgi:hypothetical protein
MTPLVETSGPLAKVSSGVSKDSESALRLRAADAEQQVRKLRMENKALEGEVRKLRADAYFRRIGKNLQGGRDAAPEKPRESEHAPVAQEAAADAWAAKLLAEERAVKAESEVLRLHTELHAARIQFALLADSSSTTKQAECREAVESARPDAVHCGCVQRCLRFLLHFFITLCVCFCKRPPTRHIKLASGKSNTPEGIPVKSFCVADRT